MRGFCSVLQNILIRPKKEKESIVPKGGGSFCLFDYDAKKFNKWLESTRRIQKQNYIQAQEKLSENQKKRFLRVKAVKGVIISWMLEPNLKVCNGEQEIRIQYFERFADILSISRWDARTLPYRPFINKEMLNWFDSFYLGS